MRSMAGQHAVHGGFKTTQPREHVQSNAKPKPKKGWIVFFTGPPFTRQVKGAGKEICQVSNDDMVMTGHLTVSDQHVSQSVFSIAR